MKDLGRKIKKLRNDAGYTQDDLGKELNVTRQAISNWERDRTEPDLNTVIHLCDVFSIPLSYFQDEKIKSVELETLNASASEIKVVDNKTSKYIYSFSLMGLFVLLLPFMLQEVPYHTDLLGNIDRSGSWFVLMVSMLIISVLNFIFYNHICLKNKLISIVLLSTYIMSILFLLSSVVEMSNIYLGFYNHFMSSYSNQISLIVSICLFIFFLLTEKIPQKSIFGFRNSVTINSKEAWEKVHSASKPIILFCALLSLYLFMVPNLKDITKMFLSFFVIIMLYTSMTFISFKEKNETISLK